MTESSLQLLEVAFSLLVLVLGPLLLSLEVGAQNASRGRSNKSGEFTAANPARSSQ
jgi:hypothetical protein